ncbi:uncharacterized protein LOC123578707 isoform X2 [Leopardus geoffroyi]|uniref:uncharacterized protein LOC123578707 isoform X2 n=1 Tax=Leopardus geoffroyi TaxID=46844 RepID=UPI001E2639C4|nr:uncharacterized protein LOC123578707 isoform X2 [Leopardus geoffroyi]
MRTRAGLGVRKSPRERRVGAGLVEGRALPRPLGWPDTEQLGAGAGAGPQLLPRLRREEAVPAGAKGAGQGLRAFSRCIIPGPPPPSAGAAAGPEAASLRRELQKWSLSCRPRSQARDPVTKSAFLQRHHPPLPPVAAVATCRLPRMLWLRPPPARREHGLEYKVHEASRCRTPLSIDSVGEGPPGIRSTRPPHRREPGPGEKE